MYGPPYIYELFQMANQSHHGPGEFGWQDQYNNDGITEKFGQLELGGLKVGGLNGERLELVKLEVEGFEVVGLAVRGLEVDGLGWGYYLLLALVLGISLLQVSNTDNW